MERYRTTRYSRCVTPSVSLSTVCSSSIRRGSWSNSRRPRAHQPDPLLRGDLPGLRERTLDPVGNQRKHWSGLAGGLVGDHEARYVAQRPLPAHASIELSYDRRPMITAPVSSTKLPYTRSNTDGSSNAQL
jgi:hypothetical protein